ncbi:TetR/AcrR family transcriptional regulator [Tuwongella immobilis]|uniref:HTH tetR-type domain-containing protein n=1 Tax=Tuwongella immobilis TaxID=692036 RepID=A0A6C2YSJ6_9BACT|nr:TetR/AcrR family transcriptional regulator [Tuwongella immobilis]VIP03852.1 family transcriptional regulator : Transcriptional regulator, TetR family OS=Pirellula staleyi (strain ATCC 27377 / DSM 6068 / ICPB 4128) GN=Psta_0781 PE=4 SV=1: TetR_N [Tuwongella immobilis]VTS05071.1 family transcriptional regulator : Transcriptional regulator, TetR family OS=Pirellula staleyi (strain ATCC 27377 / DSM 6068 / ICPB 4128) GN=Psta_0781 PE=4 SV=1: TetR_N [Tuwongella immobilis]
MNETESRLLDCALTLFAQKGYEATSVREIIEATGVTRPVLYYYCENKASLFKRLIAWKHDEANAELQRILQQQLTCEGRLRAIVRGSFAFCAQDPRVPRLMFQTAFGPMIADLAEFLLERSRDRFLIVLQIIHAGLTEGELHGGDPTALALAFCSLMDHHINILSRFDDVAVRLTPELADALVDLFLHGCGTPASAPLRFPPSVAVA